MPWRRILDAEHVMRTVLPHQCDSSIPRSMSAHALEVCDKSLNFDKILVRVTQCHVLTGNFNVVKLLVLKLNQIWTEML